MADFTYANPDLAKYDEALFKQMIEKFDKELQRTLYEPKFNFTFNASDGGIGLISADKPEPEDKGEEEWIWVTGFKGTTKDMKCRDYQFELGKQFDMPEDAPIRMCSSGFHFCDKANRVFSYYPISNGNRFFEVKALVRRWKKAGYYMTEQSGDKMVAKSIIFTRELTIDEIFNYHNNKSLNDWTTEQKEQARQTSIEKVRESIKVQKLISLGYSEAFAVFAVEKDAYANALVMGQTPGVSMDVKVLTICMAIYDD